MLLGNVGGKLFSENKALKTILVGHKIRQLNLNLPGLTKWGEKALAKVIQTTCTVQPLPYKPFH